MRNFIFYKNQIVSILTISFLLFTTSCQKDFLEKKPLGQLTSDNFFEIEDHAVWATNAVYEQMRNYDVHVFSYIGLTDIISDDTDKGSTPSDGNFLIEIDNFTFDAGNLSIGVIWAGYYQGIYRANIALENIPNIEMDENLKSRLLAECKFLRAYYYFKLVRWFGDIPLVIRTLNRDEYSQPRIAASEVYDQIIQDLEDAILVLPAQYASVGRGRATHGAAKGLLAKVKLTQGDFEKCSQLTKEIIESQVYALLPSYQQIFTEAGENSSESLFEVQTAAFETGGGGTQFNEVQGVRGTPNLGWGFNRPSDDLVGDYESGDPRREATILYPGEVLPDGSAIVTDNPNIFNERYNQKAWVPSHAGGNGNGPGNIRLLRYADVLLMAAESFNEINQPDEALIYLNLVRTRARGLSPSILPNITETDKDALRDIIWHERRVELALEQQRWFDLLRQGRAGSVMQAVGKDFVIGKHELLPLPQSEIDLSGGILGQNNGY
jgi:hypothetical protein